MTHNAIGSENNILKLVRIWRCNAAHGVTSNKFCLILMLQCIGPPPLLYSHLMQLAHEDIPHLIIKSTYPQHLHPQQLLVFNMATGWCASMLHRGWHVRMCFITDQLGSVGHAVLDDLWLWCSPRASSLSTLSQGTAGVCSKTTV